jgi:hypothetical protein
MSEKTQTYERFEKDELDSRKWDLLETPCGSGETRIVREPGAKITVSGGAL